MCNCGKKEKKSEKKCDEKCKTTILLTKEYLESLKMESDKNAVDATLLLAGLYSLDTTDQQAVTTYLTSVQTVLKAHVKTAGSVMSKISNFTSTGFYYKLNRCDRCKCEYVCVSASQLSKIMADSALAEILFASVSSLSPESSWIQSTTINVSLVLTSIIAFDMILDLGESEHVKPICLKSC